MTDDIRWCDDRSNAGKLEREVLRSDLDVEPPANLDALVWGKLAAKLGLGSALVGVATLQELSRGSAPPAANVQVTAAQAVLPAVGSSLAFVQGVLVGVLACGAVWGGVALSDVGDSVGQARSPAVVPAAREEARPRSRAEATMAEKTTEQSTIAKTVPPALGGARTAPGRAAVKESRTGVAAPSVATFGPVADAPRVTSQDRQSQLKDEAALLRRARAQLRAGELTSALELLDESKRRFAAPALYQEREALLIELLARSGRTMDAAARARVFLRSFPESPHADGLRAFVNP